MLCYAAGYRCRRATLYLNGLCHVSRCSHLLSFILLQRGRSCAGSLFVQGLAGFERTRRMKGKLQRNRIGDQTGFESSRVCGKAYNFSRPAIKDADPCSLMYAATLMAFRTTSICSIVKLCLSRKSDHLCPGSARCHAPALAKPCSAIVLLFDSKSFM